MRLHWDLTLGYIVRTPKSSTRLNTLEFKRGDAASLELVFYANSMPVLLVPGHTIRFALKPKGHYDGEPMVYTATFTEDATAKTYTAEPSFNTAALTALFASPNAPDRVDLIGEFSLRNGDDTQGWQSSQTFNVSVINDVIRGQEGTPGAAIDAQQSWLWLLATLAAGANLTFTPNHETRVLTLAATAGASGNGWSPIFGIVSDGERRVLQLTAWAGGTGDVPEGIGHFLGASNLVTNIGDAVDLRGGAGANGGPGINGISGLDGNNGWSPVLAMIGDGERRVLQLTAWTGGSGSTPAGAGSYLGVSGWVATAAEALDLRGMQGPPGSNGAAGADVTPITSISFDGTNLTIQTSTGQSFGPFMVKGNEGGNGTNGINGIDGSNGANGTNGWTPVFAIISDGERRVLQLQNWTGGSGSTPGSEGYYLGADGFTPYIYEAVDLRGASGSDGSNGADATPITNIDFDGSSLTFYTSTGQSFGPFYVRGSDGPPGADGGGGGSNGADGANGWSPQLAIVLDGERHVLQLQSWVGGGGSTPGNEGSYLGPYGYTTSISEAVDIGGALQPLAPIDNVNGTASLSGTDTVDVAQLEAQIADLQTKLQLVLDRLRSHNLISAS